MSLGFLYIVTWLSPFKASQAARIMSRERRDGYFFLWDGLFLIARELFYKRPWWTSYILLVRTASHTPANVNSKWVKDFNVKTKTVKLLKENLGGKPIEICLSNDFLDMTPQAKATKANIISGTTSN